MGNKIKIFISSVQKEFKEERRAVRDFVLSNPLLNRFLLINGDKFIMKKLFWNEDIIGTRVEENNVSCCCNNVVTVLCSACCVMIRCLPEVGLMRTF